MSVDEIRRMPQTLGLLSYRNQRNVLLELTGWDRRKDAATIRAHKADTEREQRDVFRTAAAPAPRPEPVEVVADEQ